MAQEKPNQQVASQWRRAAIDRMKQTIRDKLDDATKGFNSRDKLSHIKAQIADLKNASESTQLMERFIWTMSALVHHARFGGLREREVNQLLELGENILRHEDIVPGRSQLAYLYGELHMIQSQIHREQGEQWMAAWEQHQAFQYSRPAPPGGERFHHLGMGNRCLRLGHASMAYQHFLQAESGDDATTQLARMGRIRCLRLAGRSEAALDLIAASKTTLRFDERKWNELAWEQINLEAVLTDSLDQIIAVAQPEHPLNSPSYVIEAYLWSLSTASRSWHKKLPAMKTKARDPQYSAKALGYIFKVAMLLETVSNTEFPLRFRQQKIGEVLSKTHKIGSIEKTLLIWAACARLLATAKCYELAVVAIKEYHTLCLRLSDGSKVDCLNLVTDLTQRDWFQERCHFRETSQLDQAS